MLEEATGTRGEHTLPRGVAGGKMAWQTRNRWGPGTGQVTPCGTGPLFPQPQSSLPARPAAALTSVCALGSPALAFSRSSSKEVSMSAFMGPLPWEKQTDKMSRAGPVTCQSGQDAGVGLRPGAAPHVEIRSAV